MGFETLDFRLADGSDQVLEVATGTGGAALGNRAYADQNNVTVHTPNADTKTGFLGVLLTRRGSGIFHVSLAAKYAAAAAQTVTLTVDAYTNSAPNVDMVLPANAVPVGAGLAAGIITDNSGAGIAPSSGATAAYEVTALSWTQGTLQAGAVLAYSGLATITFDSGSQVGIPEQQQFYLVFSVTNSAAAEAITEAVVGAFELP